MIRGTASPRAKRRGRGRRLAAAGGALALGATLVTACGSSTGHAAAAGPAPSTSGAPKHGGTLHVIAATLQSNLAPTQAGVGNEDTASTAGAIYGYLGYLEPKTGAVELSFLKSITPSSGDKVWTLVLHPGIRFSDGSPFDAAAIAYTIAQQSDPNSGDSNYKTESTWKTEVVNPTTLQITLPSADAQFPAEMTQDFPYIGSPTAWKREGIDFATHPVGAGPFELQSWTQNAQLTLVPNPHYKQFAPGQPYLDKIVFTQASQTNQTQLITALQTHQDEAGWLEGYKEFDQARSAGFDVQTLTPSGGEYLLFNTARPPFNNLLAREAVSDALDHQQLADVWSPGTVPFHNLFAGTSPYYNKKYDFTGTDTAKATKLFGQLHSQGVNLDFSFVTVTAFPNVAAYVQATLDKYPGVHVKTVLDNINQYIQDGRDGNFGLFAFGVDFANPWPDVYNYFARNGSANFGKWDDPQVDRALSVIASSQDPAVLKKDYEIIAREVATQYPFYAAQGAQFGYASMPYVKGVHTIEFGTAPLFAEVWLDK